MMGAAMLKRHRFVRSLWGRPMCTQGSQAQPLCSIQTWSQIVISHCHSQGGRMCMFSVPIQIHTLLRFNVELMGV